MKSLIAICFGITLAMAASAQESGQPASRRFEFSYGFKISDLPDQSNVQVWLPIAQSNQEQDVELRETVSPVPLQFHNERRYRNRIGYCQFPGHGQPMSLKVVYQVDRREASLDRPVLKLAKAEKELFLRANSRVPIDGSPLSLLDRKKIPVEPMAAGRALYDLVEQHMTYDKSKPGYGLGDAVWACDSRTGNCTDFHSLFISLARSRNIPAKFEIGFSIGESERGTVKGYHCWAWFYGEGKGWTPIDISEADKHPELKEYYFGHLTADRIAFSVGRDIELTPKPKTEPLNYFIYPHVEVDGVEWPKDKIELDFSYRNLSRAD